MVNVLEAVKKDKEKRKEALLDIINIYYNGI